MKISNSKERIKQLMDMLELNQSDFCKRTGLQKSALSNYLNGDRVPRQDQIARIADTFNISASWLMGYDVPMREIASENLSYTESQIICAYRSASEGIKDSVCKLLDIKRDEKGDRSETSGDMLA